MSDETALTSSSITVELCRPDGVSLSIDERVLINTLIRVIDESDRDDVHLQVVLTDNAMLQDLNRTYRGINRTTDVLSFEMGDDVHLEDVPQGEVYISIERAREQAAEASRTIDEEIAHLAVHGTLHVLGSEHDTDVGHARMTELEQTHLAHWRAAATTGTS